MSRIWKIKILIGILLLAMMSVFLLPIARFGNISISTLDIMMKPWSLADITNAVPISNSLIEDELESYFMICLILGILPIAEYVVLFLIKGKLSFLTGIVGVLANNVLAYIFCDKLNGTVELIKEAISFFNVNIEIKVVDSTLITWAVLSVLVLGASIFGLLKGGNQRKMRESYQAIKEILPEDTGWHVNRNAQHDFRYIPQKPELSPEQNKSVQVKEPPSYSQASPSTNKNIHSKEFYGGLIGKTGVYQGKVRLLKPLETIFIGANQTQCDVLLNGVHDGMKYCSIRFDEKEKEYQVRPFLAAGIFLESGQPLGKNRTYCLPRGMILEIRDESNLFQLA